MRISVRYLFLLFLLYIGVFWSFLQNSICGYFSYWDELFALFGFAALFCGFSIIRRNKDNIKIFIVIILYCLFGIVGNVLWRYTSLDAAFSDLFINIKFFLCSYLCTFIFQKIEIKKYSKKIKRHLDCVSIFLLFFFVVDRIFRVFSIYEVRFGIPSEELFFTHPTYYASSIFYLLMFRIIFINNKKWENTLINIFLCIMTIFSLRIKAIAVVILFISVVLIVRNREIKRIRWFIYFLTLLSIGFISTDLVKFYFTGYGLQNYPRGVFLITSKKIMKDYFPIGAGFATFGSYMSSVEYSPIYALYGISNISGISLDSKNAITDQYWTMIAGQTGVSGLICMILVWILLYKKIKNIEKVNSSYYIAAISSFLYLVCSSTSESAICNPTCIPFGFILGLIFSQYERLKLG